MRRYRRLFVLAGITALLTSGVAAAPAQATTWITVCASPSGLNPVNCLQWTGGYPSGIVRGWAPGNYYAEIRVDTCSGQTYLCSASGWRTVADKILNGKAGYTPTYPTTKYGWFRLCSRYGNPGSWSCAGNDGWQAYWPVYLGD